MKLKLRRKGEEEREYEIVVPEDAVYFSDSEELDKESLSLSSFVFTTSTFDWFLKSGSLDQIDEFNLSARANIGTSLSCINCLASCSNDLDNSSGTIIRKSFNSSNIKSVCSNGNLEYFEIEDLMFRSSCQQCSGEYSSKSNDFELIIINLTGFSLKKEIKTLVSIINFIYHPSFFNFSQAFCFTSLPNLRQSSSVSSEFSSILSSFLRSNALLAFSAKNFLTDSDQFISGNESSSFFNFSGTDSVMFGIFIPPQNLVYYVKDVEVFKAFGKQSHLQNLELPIINEIANLNMPELIVRDRR